MDSLVIRKWVPDPAEIFIDTLPFGKEPSEEKEGMYLVAISFPTKEIMGMPRKQQIEIYEKVLETFEKIAKIQRTKLKMVGGIRFNHKNGREYMCFFSYFPKKFPFPK